MMATDRSGLTSVNFNSHNLCGHTVVIRKCPVIPQEISKDGVLIPIENPRLVRQPIKRFKDRTGVVWNASQSAEDVVTRPESAVDADIITATTVVHNLGVYLDNQLTMKKHISLLTRTCFFHLRRLRQIRRTVGREAVSYTHLTLPTILRV